MGAVPRDIPTDLEQLAYHLTREDIVILWHFSQGLRPPYKGKHSRRGPLATLRAAELLEKKDRTVAGCTPSRINFVATPKGFQVLNILERQNRLYKTPREAFIV